SGRGGAGSRGGARALPDEYATAQSAWLGLSVARPVRERDQERGGAARDRRGRRRRDSAQNRLASLSGQPRRGRANRRRGPRALLSGKRVFWRGMPPDLGLALGGFSGSLLRRARPPRCDSQPLARSADSLTVSV